MSDSEFEYWHCAGAFNPYPSIILRYQNQKYVPDLELMRKAAPSEQELQKEAGEFKAKFAGIQKDPFFDQWTAPYEMWTKMLDLIYSGNMASAWTLCDLSWPEKNPDKALFLKEFIKQLQTSEYYNAINQASFQGVAAHKN